MGTQYKDGYKVMNGGDYLVRPVDPEKSERWDTHELVELATGKVLGTYFSRQAAQVRAKQLGGNSHKSRRRSSLLSDFAQGHELSGLTPDKIVHDLTEAETVFAKKRSKERLAYFQSAERTR